MVPCFPLLGLTPSGLFMGLSSTIIYTSELILCSTMSTVVWVNKRDMLADAGHQFFHNKRLHLRPNHLFGKIFKQFSVVNVSKLYFMRLTVKEHTHDSKYIIYMCGRKSADRGRKSVDRYSYRYRNLHIVTVNNNY